jgi:hypothetical protein
VCVTESILPERFRRNVALSVVTDSPPIHAESSEPGDGEMIQELLVGARRSTASGLDRRSWPSIALATQLLDQGVELVLDDTDGADADFHEA